MNTHPIFDDLRKSLPAYFEKWNLEDDPKRRYVFPKEESKGDATIEVEFLVSPQGGSSESESEGRL